MCDYFFFFWGGGGGGGCDGIGKKGERKKKGKQKPKNMQNAKLAKNKTITKKKILFLLSSATRKTQSQEHQEVKKIKKNHLTFMLLLYAFSVGFHFRDIGNKLFTLAVMQ